MRKTIYVKVAILSAVGVLGLSSTGVAMWPTLDFSAIAPAIKNIQQEAQSVKQQIESCKELQKIKTAIGDAKEAASKFNEDVVQKAKAEAEKVKKEAEKVKKVQDDIKKAKEDYEKKKKEFDDYKNKIEEAKKEATSKINEAKSMAEEAKATAQGASALASQAVSDAKGKVSDLGSTVSGTVSSATGKVQGLSGSNSNTAQKATNYSTGSGNTMKTTSGAAINNNLASKTTNFNNASSASTVSRSDGVSKAVNTTLPTMNPATKGFSTGASQNNMPSSFDRGNIAAGNQQQFNQGIANKAVADKITDGARTFSGNIKGAEKAINPEIAGEIEEIKKIAAEEGTSTATRLLKLSVDEAIKNKDIARLDALSSIDTADIINSDSKKYEEPTAGRKAFSMPSNDDGKVAVEQLKLQAKEAKEMLRPAKKEAEGTQAPSLTSAPAMKEGASLNSNVSNGEIKMLPEKTLSKTLEKSSTGTVLSEQKSAPITKASAPQEMKSFSEPAKLAPATKENTIKEMKSSAEPAFAPVKQKSLTSPRAGFQKNSFWLDEKKTERHNIKVSYADTLKFASTVGECNDYSNVIQTKKGTVIIVPELLAKTCCLKFESGKSPDLMLYRDCAKKIVRESKGLLPLNTESLEECDAEGLYDSSLGQCTTRVDTEFGQEKLGVYNTIVAQQGTDAAAEGLIDKTKANDYVKDYFEPYKNQIAQIQSRSGGGDDASGSSNKDATTLLTLTNQQMMYLLNMIRRNYTTTLADISLRGFGNVTESAVKNEERGVKSEKEYGNTVVRQEAKNTVEYPILPENIAIKCNINAKELGETSDDKTSQADPAVTALADCFRQVVRDINVTNESDIQDAQDFLQFTQYQEILNTFEKALYQKVKSANYEETLDESEQKNNDSTTVRKANDALFNTESEVARILDDMVNVYASKLTYTAINALSKLETPTVSSSSSAASEG